MYSNFMIKALNDQILHNKVRIYNTILSRITTISGCDILVQLGYGFQEHDIATLSPNC